MASDFEKQAKDLAWLPFREDRERAIASALSSAASAARAQALEEALLKWGGNGIGLVYGLTNCHLCRKLTNDYYTVGKKLVVCLDCADAPAAAKGETRGT